LHFDEFFGELVKSFKPQTEILIHSLSFSMS
jgi:hypothetical protein